MLRASACDSEGRKTFLLQMSSLGHCLALFITTDPRVSLSFSTAPEFENSVPSRRKNLCVRLLSVITLLQ